MGARQHVIDRSSRHTVGIIDIIVRRGDGASAVRVDGLDARGKS